MKIVIVGAGALGSIVAGMLAHAGAPVAVVARGKRAHLLDTQGVTLTGLAEINQKVRVIRPGDPAVDADYVFVCTKTFDTTAALAGVSFTRPPVALSLQNGVGKNEQLARIYGESQVLGAAATISGEVLDDGRVRFTLNNSLPLGELGGGLSPRATALAELLRNAGLAAEAADNIRSIEWTKYAGFLPLMAVSLLTRLPTGRALSNPQSARVAALLLGEVAVLARASGVQLSNAGALPIATMADGSVEDAAVALVAFGNGMRERAPEHRVSALQDLLRGSRLEVDDLLGHAVELGARLDVAVPTIATCYGLCAALGDT